MNHAMFYQQIVPTNISYLNSHAGGGIKAYHPVVGVGWGWANSGNQWGKKQEEKEMCTDVLHFWQTNPCPLKPKSPHTHINPTPRFKLVDNLKRKELFQAMPCHHLIHERTFLTQALRHIYYLL